MNLYCVEKADINKNKLEIRKILELNLPNVSGERFVWNYEKNISGSPVCFIAKRASDDSFVGSCSLFPRSLMINSKISSAAVAGDFAVNKEHRPFGPALSLQKAALSTLGTDFRCIYTVPNKQSTLIFRRLGYHEIGDFEKYVKVLMTEYKTGKLLHPIFLTKRLKGALDMLLKIISKEFRYKRANNIMVRIHGYFDSQFDRFLNEASADFKIIGRRTIDFLNWRYMEAVDHEYKIFSLTEKGDLIAYLVYYIKDNMAHIADFLFKDSKTDLERLFSEFIIYARQQKYGSISLYYLGGQKIIKILEALNFFPRKEEDSKLFVAMSDNSKDEFILCKELWHFVEGDTDL